MSVKEVVVTDICLYGSEERHKISLKIAGVSAEIRTGNLPNTNLECCWYVSLLGEVKYLTLSLHLLQSK
jgi:hypothetical protein